MSLFKGLRQLGTPPLYKIANEMERVRSSLERLARELDVPEDIVYNRDEYDAREKKRMEGIFREVPEADPSSATPRATGSEAEDEELPPL